MASGLASTTLNGLNFNSDWLEMQLAQWSGGTARGAYNKAFSSGMTLLTADPNLPHGPLRAAGANGSIDQTLHLMASEV